MRTISRAIACRKPRRSPGRAVSLERWARSVIADPASHYATDRETRIVAELLNSLAVAR